MTDDGAGDRLERVPTALQGRYDAIVAFTDQCCEQHLTEEYRDLCRRLTAKLCRKRPSPLATGKANTWACGIVYAMGRVNFLFDSSQTPYMRADELCSHFGLSASTGSAKSTAILNLLNSGQADPQWSLPSRLADNPVAWLIKVNGFIVDARHAPREVQEEAFRRGLIPYLP
ncbi:DUF6398 domain-containing protein [uncultured Lamprocystis sp.]|jgi:hypothetical protein|uniref:DUF6398 domain-containing protein n=1 Tax=uncultured Lamprocystis sp. TaxID=543132 RepID=UPI0025FBBC00|nr:DUF6398 domain-containing protein [uncultured Lamprocystis sp.]